MWKSAGSSPPLPLRPVPIPRKKRKAFFLIEKKKKKKLKKSFFIIVPTKRGGRREERKKKRGHSRLLRHWLCRAYHHTDGRTVVDGCKPSPFFWPPSERKTLLISIPKAAGIEVKKEKKKKNLPWNLFLMLLPFYSKAPLGGSWRGTRKNTHRRAHVFTVCSIFTTPLEKRRRRRRRTLLDSIGPTVCVLTFGW